MSKDKNTLDGQESEWLTSIQAANLLGIHPNRFHYYIKAAHIAVEPGTQAGHRRYSRADVMQLARKLSDKKTSKPKEKLLIDWIMPSDIPAALKMLQRVYSADIDLAEFAIYQSWRKNNNQLSLGAFSTNREYCRAAIQLVPLPESVILDILSGKRHENSITPDEVRSYTEPGAYHLLATSAAALPGHPYLLYRLLDRYMDFWVDMAPERHIQRVYAQAVSERGEMLVQHFFMLPRWDLAPDAFMLDLSRPTASRIIRRFKARLEAKR